MSVWAGWQSDLLTHAVLPDTAANRRFLSDWHSHAETNCKNNPIDLSVKDFDGSDCHALPGLIAKAQSYPTHAAGSHAFHTQIHQSDYAALFAAMQTGNPYTADNTGPASEAISRWGSRAFGQRFFAETDLTRSGGPGGQLAGQGQALRGWSHLQRAINHDLPKALHASQQARHAALRSLARAHRVRH